MSIQVVAELSGCHGGKEENVLQLINIAKDMEVDRIKFQCFHPDALAQKRAAGHLGEQYSEKKLRNIYRETYTKSSWWPNIKRTLGDYPWSCSVFSEADLAFMEYLRCPMYKIASFEFDDHELIKAVAAKRKPMVLSFNQNHTVADITAVWDIVRDCPAVTFLYATPYDKFDPLDEYAAVVHSSSPDIVPAEAHVGLSDHSPSGDHTMLKLCHESWVINMAERHLRLDNVSTPDDAFADTPEQFRNYLQYARAV